MAKKKAGPAAGMAALDSGSLPDVPLPKTSRRRDKPTAADTPAPAVGALAPWFGSNRILGAHVARLAGRPKWVGVLFAGGFAELLHLRAPTVLANDLHAHVMNLASVVADPRLCRQLYRRARRLAFHPQLLADAQERCRARELTAELPVAPDLEWALDYFVCAWMSRSGTSGTRNEFDAGMATRFTASGGDSVTRLVNASSGLLAWQRIIARVGFTTLDVFEFLALCHDREGHVLYADPPFPRRGLSYKYGPGEAGETERAWHARLAAALAAFTKARVICRFYEDALVRELYPEVRWEYHPLEGRTQTNGKAAELLLVSRPAETPA